MARRKRSHDPPPGALAFVSLGCAKNLVDSEVLLGYLLGRGWLICADERDADLILINTCGFIEEARGEAVETIRRALQLKADGLCRGVLALGCFPQRLGADIPPELEGLDAWVGLCEPAEIDQICLRLMEEDRGEIRRVPEKHRPVPSDLARLRLTPRHYAYLRISEGCNNRCHYCTIPLIRGPLRSKPPEQILKEADELLRDGAREINLIGQDTTSYGIDLHGAPGLAGLLVELARTGADWLRLLYTHPAHLTAEVIDTVASEPRICHYLDLPVQHLDDGILERMHRRVTRREIFDQMKMIRDRLPDAVIRTSIIVGFPGETDACFDALLRDLLELRFDRLGAFPYSREPDTVAADYPDQVPDDVKAERFNRLMTQQQNLAEEVNRRFVGRVLETLIDEAGPPARGRTYADAPDVDGVITLSGENWTVGELVQVRVTGARGYDLEGERIP